MFDTFRGLPVHVLVVHAVVVLTPLMAVATAVVACVARWRRRFAWWVVAGDAVVLAVVWVATRSGSQLLNRVGDNPAIHRHANLGHQMLWFAVALLAAAVLVALVRDLSAPLPLVAAVVAVVASVAAVGWVIRTGEAGSSAVWRPVVENTSAK